METSFEASLFATGRGVRMESPLYAGDSEADLLANDREVHAETVPDAKGLGTDRVVQGYESNLDSEDDADLFILLT